MNDLEERLRRGLRAYSDRVRPESIRPLHETPESVKVTHCAMACTTSCRRGRDWRCRRNDAGAPARRAELQRRGQGRQPASSGMPRYYVTAFETYADGGKRILTKAVVHNSRTGAALASVNVPTLMTGGGSNGVNITGAGDDRTFVIYQTATVSPVDRLARFLLLRVSADGRSARLTKLRLKVPRSLAVDYAALSPDGSRLAMQEQYCPDPGSCKYTGVRVITLATGKVRTWTTTENDAPFNVSWAGNSAVAFLWGYHYRQLDVTGQGGDLLASRVIASPPPEPTHYSPNALVTADRSTVITSTVKNFPAFPGKDTVIAKITELDARSGKLLRVLQTVTMHGVSTGQAAQSLDQQCKVLSLGPVGVHLLVACNTFGRLDGSVFTPLPGFPSPSSSGISGQITGAW